MTWPNAREFEVPAHLGWQPALVDICPGHIDCLLHLEHHAPAAGCIGYAIAWMRDHYFVDDPVGAEERYQQEYEKRVGALLVAEVVLSAARPAGQSPRA